MPDPRAAPYIAPSGVKDNAMGSTIGAAFLITLTTDLVTFLTALETFLKVFFSQPNSLNPSQG